MLQRNMVGDELGLCDAAMLGASLEPALSETASSLITLPSFLHSSQHCARLVNRAVYLHVKYLSVGIVWCPTDSYPLISFLIHVSVRLIRSRGDHQALAAHRDQGESRLGHLRNRANGHVQAVRVVRTGALGLRLTGNKHHPQVG
jgi:hypothetical protein